MTSESKIGAPPLTIPFDEFMARRTEQQAWAFANGFNNGDPATNGEFATARLLVPLCQQVIDVGAHKGDFAFVAAAVNPSADFTLVEPNPALQQGLLARFPKARIITFAHSDQPGQGWLLVDKDQPISAALAEHGFARSGAGANAIPMSVEVTRIDDHMEFEPRQRALFLKIDASGFEAKILRGAERTIMIPQSVAVQFEHSFRWREAKESFKDAFYWLEQRGFDIRRITPYGLERVRFYTVDLEGVQYANYVALRGVALDTIALAADLPSVYGMTTIARFPEAAPAPAAAPVSTLPPATPLNLS